MIPAILSAVFVVYLYKTLNQPSASNMAASCPTLDESDAQMIVARLRDLQARVERLANTVNSEETRR